MHYQVSRNGQMYGPYTLEDLQRYVQTGNVLLTDQAKNETMADWLPVSQILAGQAMPTQGAPMAGTGGFANPSFAQPDATGGFQTFQPQPGAMAASQYPDPPNLHWGLVLLFGILTCGIFSLVYDTIQAAWMKRVDPSSKALTVYIAAIAIVVLTFIASFVGGMADGLSRVPGASSLHGTNPVAGVLNLIYVVVLIVGRFSMRSSMESHFNSAEPIGLRLSGVMTFFFGGIYFQYHFNRINAMKQAARMGLPRPY